MIDIPGDDVNGCVGGSDIDCHGLSCTNHLNHWVEESDCWPLSPLPEVGVDLPYRLWWLFVVAAKGGGWIPRQSYVQGVSE